MKPRTWFNGRTYHFEDFKNISKLIDLKKKNNFKISVAIPTLNEEKTIGLTLDKIITNLVNKHPLIDQIAVIDSRSEDKTVEIARKKGAEVYIDDEIRPDLGTAKGKGEALWKSLFVLEGDIVLWVDADIENFDTRFIYGLLGPLLYQKEIGFCKAFYTRPLKVDGGLKENEGGRVTEILARPLLNLFYPDLSYIIQPLSGEYGGKKDVLMSIPFFTGYAVEIGMLVELYKKYGLKVMSQVDLEKRIHLNQPTLSLGKMGFAILQAILMLLEEEGKLELNEKMNLDYNMPSLKKSSYDFEKTEIKIFRRPPANSV